MSICLLCKKDFENEKKLKKHERKKNSCVSQETILDLYKNLHKLIEFKLNTETDNIIDNIKNTINVVKFNPDYKKLNEYGKESIIMIDLTKIEQLKSDSLEYFIRNVYCNAKYPENRTVKIQSKYGNYCKVFKNDKWMDVSYPKTMLEIINFFYNTIREVINSSNDEDFIEYAQLLNSVVKKDEKSIRKIMIYCNKFIRPLLYNETKNDKEFTYLVSS